MKLLDGYGEDVIKQVAEIFEYGFIKYMNDKGEIEIIIKGVEEVIRGILLYALAVTFA